MHRCALDLLEAISVASGRGGRRRPWSPPTTLVLSATAPTPRRSTREGRVAEPTPRPRSRPTPTSSSPATTRRSRRRRRCRPRSTAFLANPNDATLAAAKQAWLTARDDYLPTEAFRFYDGPIDNPKDGPEGQINAWPMDEAYVDYVDRRARTPGSSTTPPSTRRSPPHVLVEANEKGGEKNISTGWHAIEFLLWGQDNTATGAGPAPGDRLHDGRERRASRRLPTTRRPTSSSPTSPACATSGTPTTARTGRSSCPTPSRRIANMLRGIGALSAGELAGERMAVAFETKDQEDEHSCFSDNTNADVVGDLVGIQRVYLADFPGVDGTSISDLVAKVEPEARHEARRPDRGEPAARRGVPGAVRAADRRAPTAAPAARRCWPRSRRSRTRATSIAEGREEARSQDHARGLTTCPDRRARTVAPMVGAIARRRGDRRGDAARRRVRPGHDDADRRRGARAARPRSSIDSSNAFADRDPVARPRANAARSRSATASSTTTGSPRPRRPRAATGSGRCSTRSRARRATSTTAGPSRRRAPTTPSAGCCSGSASRAPAPHGGVGARSHLRRPDPGPGDRRRAAPRPRCASPPGRFRAATPTARAYTLLAPSYEIVDPAYGPLAPNVLRVTAHRAGGVRRRPPRGGARRPTISGPRRSRRRRRRRNLGHGEPRVGRRPPGARPRAASAGRRTCRLSSSRTRARSTATSASRARCSRSSRARPVEIACLAAPTGGDPEVDDHKLDRVTFYTRTLAVPARRDVNERRGASTAKQLFRTAGCSSCHMPTLRDR